MRIFATMFVPDETVDEYRVLLKGNNKTKCTALNVIPEYTIPGT